MKQIILLSAFLISIFAGAQESAVIYKGTATGTDTYTVSVSSTTSPTLLDGKEILMKVSNANTTASTVRVVNSNGVAYPVKDIYLSGSALTGGELTTGVYHRLVYNSSASRFDLDKAGTGGVPALTFNSPLSKSGSAVSFNLLPLPTSTTTAVGDWLLKTVGTTSVTSKSTITDFFNMPSQIFTWTALAPTFSFGALTENLGGTHNFYTTGSGNYTYESAYTLTSTALATLASASISITGTSVRFPNAGTAGANKVFTSDANGYATWQDNAANSLTLSQVLANGRDADVTGTINGNDGFNSIDLNNRQLKENTDVRLEWDAGSCFNAAGDETVNWYSNLLKGSKWSYDVNYGAQFTARSLVDKGYVDSVKTVRVTASAVSGSFPTGTSSATGVMQAVGSTITPVGSGKVLVTICGSIQTADATTAGVIQIKYGTGTPPVNGAAPTGTDAGGWQELNNAAGSMIAPFSVTAIVSGLTPSTTYWFDLHLLSSSGADIVNLVKVTTSLVEL